MKDFSYPEETTAWSVGGSIYPSRILALEAQNQALCAEVAAESALLHEFQQQVFAINNRDKLERLKDIWRRLRRLSDQLKTNIDWLDELGVGVR